MSDLKGKTPRAHNPFFRALQRTAIVLASLYGLSLVLVLTPIVQTYVLYAHHIHFFGFNKFEHPQDYGLAHGKTVNLQLKSSDNTTLGAWFIFSESFHRSLPDPLLGSAAPPRDVHADTNDNTSHDRFPNRVHIPSALQKRPTILFLHGNTGTRAHPLRTLLYTALTSRLDANILAVDYRGFGDSEGHPSVEGVGRDARAGWDWLMEMGAKEGDVLVLGHSLGTAIAGLLSAELGKEGVKHRGTVLLSPFSSVRKLIDEYYLFGFLPLLKPVSRIPYAPRLVTWSLVHRFDTLTLVPSIKSSVLIAHADDDFDIPSTHASLLFDEFLAPHLSLSSSSPSPALDQDATTLEDPSLLLTQNATNLNHPVLTRSDLVQTVHIPEYALFETFRPHVVQAEGGREVALLRTERGGHDIGRSEGVQDAIGRMFGFF